VGAPLPPLVDAARTSGFQRPLAGQIVTIGRLKSLLIAFAAGALAVLAFSSPATAATPCWKTLINDWYDGRIDGTYPAHCYREAINNAPEDVKTYSSLQEDLTRALQAAVKGKVPGGSRGRHGASQDSPTPSGTSTNENGGTVIGTGGSNGPGSGPGNGLFTKAIDSLGPKNADSLPLPLIILASIALLLLAAGAAGFIARRVQARRAQDLATPPEGSS
jgi:hypothetical protein